MRKITIVTVVFLVSLILLTSGCIIPKQKWVEMRDGIRLATDVYLPTFQVSPHGSILIRTPYNKDAFKEMGGILSFLRFPTVVQDMRGRFASEGVDTVFRDAHTDGPDTLYWIANQSWSNGEVATYGKSASGICQYFMAGSNPPYLACQYIKYAAPDIYKHLYYPGGQFRKHVIEKWLKHQDSLFILPEIWENENYTLQYWENVTLEGKWQNVNVPAIHIGGWFDTMLQGIIDGFVGYQYFGGPGAKGKSKLIMGPWTHFDATGDLVFPKNSEDTFSVFMLRDMLKQYIGGDSNAFDRWPAVSYYVMGDVDDVDAPGNEWRYSDDWPITHISKEWYFHEDGLLSVVPPAGHGNSLNFTYDPMDPVPTMGGFNLFLDAGPYDQRPVENRSDVLLFTSPVLDEPYEATGPIGARLFVSSDCPDTDFTVKLTDVYPDGRSMLITDGILRMRNRNGMDHWEFMNPGEIYEAEVDLWSTSYVWNTGHQIRVAISSSNYPRFLNNPNTADGIYKNTTYNIAHNSVYIDSIYSSCIILPEIEQGVHVSAKKLPIFSIFSPLFYNFL